MFPFFKSKVDDFDSNKLECLTLLQELRQELTVSPNGYRQLALKHITQSIYEVQKSKNQLTLFLPIKWLERELGAMIFDKKLQLTENEWRLWNQIKNLSSSYSAGHGTALGL